MSDEETRPELVAQAQVLGLSASGSRAQLRARIDAHLEGVAQRAKNVTAKDYTTGKWSGLPNYRCNRCTFASLKKRAIILHVAEAHG